MCYLRCKSNLIASTLLLLVAMRMVDSSLIVPTSATNDSSRVTKEVNIYSSDHSVRINKWRKFEFTQRKHINETAGRLEIIISNLLNDLNNNDANKQHHQGNISTSCKLELAKSVKLLSSGDYITLQYLSSNPQSQQSLLSIASSKLTDLGHFDKCLSSPNSYSQYCTIQLKAQWLPLRPKLRQQSLCKIVPQSNSIPSRHNISLGKISAFKSQILHYSSIRFGICLPSACSQHDLHKLASLHLANHGFLIAIKSCESATTNSNPVWQNYLLNLDSIQLFVIIVLIFILLLTVIGSFFKISAEEVRQSNATCCIQASLSLNQSETNCLLNAYKAYATSTCALESNLGRTTTQLANNLTQTLRQNNNKLRNKKFETSRQTAALLEFQNNNNSSSINLSSAESSLDRNAVTNNQTNTDKSFYQHDTDSDQQHTTGVKEKIFNIKSGTVINKQADNLNSIELKAQMRDNSTKRDSSFLYYIKKFIICFSLKKNFAILTQIECKKHTLRDSNLMQLNGLSTLASIWLLFATSVEYIPIDATDSLLDSSFVQLACYFRPITCLLSSSLASDTLIFVFAFAKTCAFLSSRQRPVPCPVPPFRPLTMLTVEYLKILPSYSLAIGIAILLPTLGSGPIWREMVEPTAKSCRSNWISNLALVNNFNLQNDNHCLTHTWLFASIGQTLLIGLLAAFCVVQQSVRFASSLLLVSSLFGSIITFLQLYVNNWQPSSVAFLSPNTPEKQVYIDSFMTMPWVHLQALTIGLTAGYWHCCCKHDVPRPELSNNRYNRQTTNNNSTRLKPSIRLLISILVLIFAFATSFGLNLHDATFNALHATCLRPIWCAGVASILLNDDKSKINSFLAWRYFQLSGRLTFCLCLTSPLVVMTELGISRKAIDMNTSGIVLRFLALLLMCYIIAFIFSLLVEAPTRQLLRNCLGSYWSLSLSTREIENIISKSSCFNSKSIISSSSISPSSFATKFATNKLFDMTNPENSKRHNMMPSLLCEIDSYKSSYGSANCSHSPKLPDSKLVSLISDNNLSSSCSSSPFGLLDKTNNLNKQVSSDNDDGGNETEPIHWCGAVESSKYGMNINERSFQGVKSNEEFHEKLALAIGRGFKLRSKLSTRTTTTGVGINTNNDTEEQEDNGKKKQELPLVAKRVSTAIKTINDNIDATVDGDQMRSKEPVGRTNEFRGRKIDFLRTFHSHQQQKQ